MFWILSLLLVNFHLIEFQKLSFREKHMINHFLLFFQVKNCLFWTFVFGSPFKTEKGTLFLVFRVERAVLDFISSPSVLIQSHEIVFVSLVHSLIHDGSLFLNINRNLMTVDKLEARLLLHCEFIKIRMSVLDSLLILLNHCLWCLLIVFITV